MDWIDHLTKSEAQAILASSVATRFDARDDRGEKATRYAALTAAEKARITEKAR